MSQRIQLVCDPHQFFDNQDVEGKTVTMDLGGGPKLLETCGCEDDRSMKQMRLVLETLGREPEPPQRTTRVRRNNSSGKAHAKGEYPCRFCPEVPDTPQGRGLHEFRNHPWQRLLWEERNEYTKNTKLEQKHLDSRLRRLKLLEQAGLTLEQAAEKEKEIGRMSVQNSSAEQALSNIVAQFNNPSERPA